ncbi:MAG: alpha-ketoacid dehydrogenase subunit beta [Parcubacteria group bacterium]|nr:alpha-ketoacid dehydrogenase subunit beta [Parcubacteria group bacterium]
MNSECVITFSQALNESLSKAMSRDKNIVLLGEEISFGGGRYYVTRELAEKFGKERVVDTPLIEDMIVGAGIGMALGGLHPIVELMYGAFLSLSIDDIYRAATWNFRYPFSKPISIIIRVASGAYDGRGPEFGANFMSWFQHIPGLKIIIPSNPYDAKGLLNAAIESKSPILFFEDRTLYPTLGKVSTEDYIVPIGKSKIVLPGGDITLICCGYMTHLALRAAKMLSKENISAEILDLKTLVPLDIETIMMSAGKTRRVAIIEQGIMRGGIGAEIGMRVVDNNKNIIVKRIAAPNIPPAPLAWEHHTLPSAETISAEVKNFLSKNNSK